MIRCPFYSTTSNCAILCLFRWFPFFGEDWPDRSGLVVLEPRSKQLGRSEFKPWEWDAAGHLGGPTGSRLNHPHYKSMDRIYVTIIQVKWMSFPTVFSIVIIIKLKENVGKASRPSHGHPPPKPRVWQILYWQLNHLKR